MIDLVVFLLLFIMVIVLSVEVVENPLAQFENQPSHFVVANVVTIAIAVALVVAYFILE